MIPPLKHFPVGVRLILTFFIFLFSAYLFSQVSTPLLALFYGMDMVRADAVATGHFATNYDRYGYLIIQALFSIIGFGLTALVVSQLETGTVARRLALGSKPVIILVAFAAISILVVQPFIQYLIELSQNIHLPDAMKPYAEVEQQEDQLTNSLLDTKSFGLFLAGAFVFAIVPAVCEELFFRALILGDLLKSKVNPYVAILATGLLFSIVHFEVHNLLVLWVLGSFLGYLYYISGSLWVSVTAHFINNFLFVLLKYLYNTGMIKTDLADADMPVYAVIISAIVFAGCLFTLNRLRRPLDFDLELNEPDLAINEDEH